MLNKGINIESIIGASAKKDSKLAIPLFSILRSLLKPKKIKPLNNKNSITIKDPVDLLKKYVISFKYIDFI
tara:strand:+ start:149 stop:361 length:213 start_codon:yes stop_codon:yes gene_type:complete